MQTQDRTVDIQAHYMPPRHVEGLRRAAEHDPQLRKVAGVILERTAVPGAKVTSVDEGRIAEMDAAGVDVQVLSTLAPGAVIGADAPEAAALAAATNDELVEAAGWFPGRFLVLATLPLPHVEESIAELERVAAHPLVRGVLAYSESFNWMLDDPSFDPLYERAAALGMPVVLHPPVEALPAAYDAFRLGASIGSLVSTSLAGLRLILSGTLDRIPKLELVIPHLGGVVPYLTQRVMDINGQGAAEHDLLHYLRHRVWSDSCSNWEPALVCAVETFGADRIMLASDYPFRGDLKVSVGHIAGSRLSDESKAAILSGTAQRWFGE
jgi:predicted TIM-barrel fold metal-dependent hydrolase